MAKTIPLEEDHFKKSKTKVVFTWVVTVLIALVLTVGGVAGFFGNKSTSLLTVDGNEVLTPNIVENIQRQLNAMPGINPSQKYSQIMQFLAQLQNSASWNAFAHQSGINFSPVNLKRSLKPLYNQQKQQYESQTNNPFPPTFKQFLDQNTDSFNLSVFSAMLTSPLKPSSLDIQSEYSATNTKSQVKYSFLRLDGFLVLHENSNIEQFYNHLKKNQIILKKTLLVSSFDSDEKATTFLDQMKANSQLKKNTFTKSSKSLQFDKYKDSEIFSIIEKTQINDITPSFEYKGKFYIGKVISNLNAPFSKLNNIDKKIIALQYFHSLNKNQQKPLIDRAKKILSQNTSPNIQKGTSVLFNMAQEEDIKDSSSRKSLPFASVENALFTVQSFQKKGFESVPEVFDNVLYKIKVIKRIQPSFPISIDNEQSISSAIQQRESQLWNSAIQQKMAKKVKIKIHYNNIAKIFNL